MADLRTHITALLLGDFKAEAEAGFPTVIRIPSTDAVKFLDYFATLKSAEPSGSAAGLHLPLFPRGDGLRGGTDGQSR
jgi:hypothetical protein